ncbi:PA2169 family four-helix-bundle protein [Pseudomonas turukhanskensis]|nr:PA2169 family four-helix-bundle protein [Pseudomonas turukhanskensis]
MDNKDTISLLNNLIETSKDGQKGFRECADDLKNPELKGLFTQRSAECAAAASELQQLVRSLGGDPETSSSAAGTLHRGWVNLKSVLTGHSEEAILNECERGEDVALKHYKEALEKDLPSNVRSILEKQRQGVQRNHDQVKALRNMARAS